MTQPTDSATQNLTTQISTLSLSNNQNITSSLNNKKDLQTLLIEIQDTNPNKQFNALIEVRKLLSLEKSPPIDEVVNLGFLPILVSFLQKSDDSTFQLEAAWALTNVASGTSEHIEQLMQAGAFTEIVHCLQQTKDYNVKEQCIWAIGNIAGDSVRFRDYVLSLGVLDPILQIVSSTKNLTTLRNGTWAISNFCRGKPQPDYKLVSPAIPILAQLLYQTDTEVLIDACWALSYLSDGPNERIQAIIDANCVPRLVELLVHDNVHVCTPALRTIGNIVTGDDKQTQIVINYGVLPIFAALIKNPKTSIKKETCWAISNIAGGTVSQIQDLLDANLVPPLVSLLQNQKENLQVKTEAVWALGNMCAGGSLKQIQYLVQCGVLDAFVSALSETNPKFLLVVLDAMENIFKQGEKLGSNPFTGLIIDRIDKLESLQSHSSDQVYTKVVSLLETYFQAEEDAEAAAPVPME